MASNSDINKAFLLAKECDEESSFGGIVAFNKSINIKKDYAKAHNNHSSCQYSLGNIDRALDSNNFEIPNV